MRYLRTKLSNEEGLTLIEVLVSLVLFSIIGTITYIVLLGGINTEKRIYAETLIRDEADLVMARIIEELYTATDKQVELVPNESNMVVFKQSETLNKKIGFSSNRPVIDGKVISSEGFNFQGSTISIEEYGNLETEEKRSIKVELIVSKEKSNAKPLTLKSQFRLMEE